MKVKSVMHLCTFITHHNEFIRVYTTSATEYNKAAAVADRYSRNVQLCPEIPVYLNVIVLNVYNHT